MLIHPAMIVSFPKRFPLAWNYRLLIWNHCLTLSFFLGLLLWGPLGISWGQNFDQYQLLKSSGPIPSQFLSPNSLMSSHPSVPLEARSPSKEVGAFLQSHSYYTYQLLQSGKVLFRDPISEYLNEIADHLLKDQPEIRKSIQIYTVRSTQPNAFASNDGVILVNLGLLPQLNSEAELAFILCHEISHFVQQHPLELFQNSQSILSSNSSPRSNSFQKQLEKVQLYSQQKEDEADSLGWELFLRSQYDLRAPKLAIEQLLHPFPLQNTWSFSPNYLELENQQIPAKAWLPDSLAEVASVSGIDPSYLASHPSPQSRLLRMKKWAEAIPNHNRSFWMLGKERFDRLQNISLFESCHLFLLNQQYESAIYYAMGLQHSHPNSTFLKKIIAQSFYGLAKYAIAGRFWDVHQDFEEVIGEKRKLHFLTEQLLPEELKQMALAHLSSFSKGSEEDIEIQLMEQDLLEQKPIAHSEYLFLKSLPDKQRLIEGANLGLQKVVFVDPMYLSMDYRKDQQILFAESDQQKRSFTQLIQAHAGSVDLEAEVLSPHLLQRQEVDKFNDIALLNDWMEEKLATYELGLISIHHEEVQQLTSMYGTAHFVWTEVISTRQKRTGKLLIASFGILLPPVLPYALYYLLTPKYETISFTMVFDIQNGTPVLMLPKTTQMKDRIDLLHSLTYDLVFQLHQNPD